MKCKTGKQRQAVYDVIKNVREGNPTPFSFEGKDYIIFPYEDGEQGFLVYEDKTIPYSYYLCQLVLCKYHRTKIGVRMICWKDAGPNPKLYDAGGGFIPFKNVYGIAVETSELCESSQGIRL